MNGWTRDRTASAAFAWALLASIALVPAAPAADPPLTVTPESGTGPCPQDCLTVTASRFFELRFNRGAGGAIDELHDLAADPSENHDLAGSLNKVLGLHNAGFSQSGAPTRFYNVALNGTSAKLDLLEATPVRVRVRQEAFYQNDQPPNDFLPGIKGVGDYSVYPSGRAAFRWTRMAGSPLSFLTEYHELVVRWTTVTPLDTWAAYRETGGTPGTPGTDAFVLAQNEQTGARTDFLHVLSTTWSAADQIGWTFQPLEERLNLYWVTPPGSLLAGDKASWSFLTSFKPTNLVDHADPAVTSRSGDYRLPALLTFSKGLPWVDAAENTVAGTDFFNESEAAYPLDLDPALGLDFDIGASPAQPRYSPFFKIRQWRSLGPPRQITFGGRILTRHVGYDADLKPVSRAHWAPKLLWHCSVEGNPGSGDCTAPDVGTPAGGGGQNGVAFAPGRYGKAAGFTAPNQYVTADAGDFNAAEGAVELWYRPGYDSATDSADRVLWSRYLYDGTNYYCFLFWKDAAKALHFTIATGVTCGGVQWSVASGAYSWRPSDWVHLKATWSATSAVLRILVNGRLLSAGPLAGFAPAPAIAAPLQPTYFGGCPGACTFGITGHAMGLIDEPRIYGALWNNENATHPLANGGLQTDSREFLASSSQNFPLAFIPAPPDGSDRANYLFLGADSKFRGLNVWLDANGSGVSPNALVWDYWRGDTGEWDSLEAPASPPPGFAFVDTTNSFTQRGPVYWTDDPPGWEPFSVDGGPDLYYVRVHLAPSAGVYGTPPVERVIKTDILLLQHGGDVTVPGQALVVEPPATPGLEPTDVEIEKTSLSTTAEQWETVRYTLTITNNGSSPATLVELVDALPPDLEFVAFSHSGGGFCDYAAATRTFSCSFPVIAGGTFETVTLDAIVLAANGNVTNRASVTAGEPDPDSTNDSAEWTVSVTPGPSDVVPFLTVTSRGVENVVEFLNPAAGDCDVTTVVVRKNGGYPASSADGIPLLCVPVGLSNKKCSCVDGSGLSPGITYYYGAFALGGTAPGRFNTGRPPDASQAAVRWANSTGTFGLAAPTVTQYGVISTSNDRAVYSMQRGVSGGTWATGAPSGDWRPYLMGGIVQSRSPFVPSFAVVEDTVYLGAQDGRVYALNAQTGNVKAGWTFTQLGATVQAAPAGIFLAFGGGFDDLLVGTREFGFDNRFCALKPGDGSWAAGTMSASCYGGVAPPTNPGRLGIISGMAAVDYGSPPHVYFASRKRDAQAGNDQTLWRLQIGSAPVLQYSSSLALGEIESSPILANDAGGAKRVYVGSSTGTLYSLPPDLGAIDRTLGIGDGQVRGFVFPDRSNPGNVYFATDNSVWGVHDDGSTLGTNFGIGLIPGVRPSSPVLLAGGFLYVGGTDGRLYKIDTSGVLTASVRLGASKSVVGAPSYDGENGLIHVGTEPGVFYAVDPTLMSADPTCVAQALCTGVNLGQPCFVSNDLAECPTRACQGASTCSP